MKISVVAILALLLIGCESSPQRASLSAAQARAVAVKLANEKAAALYDCRPFQDGQPANFTQGHWTWKETCGHGQGDLEATVELAEDGSTNRVDIKYLNNLNLL